MKSLLQTHHELHRKPVLRRTDQKKLIRKGQLRTRATRRSFAFGTHQGGFKMNPLGSQLSSFELIPFPATSFSVLSYKPSLKNANQLFPTSTQKKT